MGANYSSFTFMSITLALFAYPLWLWQNSKEILP